MLNTRPLQDTDWRSQSIKPKAQISKVLLFTTHFKNKNIFGKPIAIRDLPSIMEIELDESSIYFLLSMIQTTTENIRHLPIPSL